MKIKLTAAAGLLLTLGAVNGQKTIPRADGARAYEHVEFLASDALRGRKDGTPEYMKAAEYVAAKMKEYGLKPAGDNGTYFQTVSFKSWIEYGQPLRLEIAEPRRRVYFAGRSGGFSPVAGTGSGTVRGRAVFAGYGVVSETPAWDDYAGLDVKGAIVLVLPEAPAPLGEASRGWALEKKLQLAASKGAVGLIEMDLSVPGSTTGPRPPTSMLRDGAVPAGFVVLRAGRDFLDDLFYSVWASWRDAVSKILRLKKPRSLALAAAVEMEAHFVRGERQAVNVLGFLPGADSGLKDEAVVIGGHLDHIGVGLNAFIYPGADDDATGVAVVLETARALQAAKHKPGRTVVFAAWAGEELGLVGSRYYTEHPVVPLAKTVCYLNIDMVGTGDDDLLVGGMYEYGRFFDLIKSKLDPSLAKKLKPRLNYQGSDHSSFWGKGVTALSLRTGEILTQALDDEHPEYHRPGDRPEWIEPELLRLAAQYHLEVLGFLAETRDNLLDPKFRAEFIHKDAFVADLHADTIGRFMEGQDLRRDLPSGHIDIPKLKRGAVDLQVLACYAPPPQNELDKARSAKIVFDQIEAVYRLVGQNPDDLVIIKSSEDIGRIRNSGKTGILIGIEGGYAIENDLDLLRAFHRAGVRLMTLTHWTRTDWADASGDARPELGGLTPLGEEVVQEMNRLGLVIDISHAHDETVADVLRISRAPVVASHSCARALSDHIRNLSDDQLKALAKADGVVGINYLPGFLKADNEKRRQALWEEIAAKSGLSPDRRSAQRSDPEHTNKGWAEYQVRLAGLDKTLPPVDVGTVVDHIDHIVKVTGSVNHVGLGSDFDGIDATPAGLENAGRLEALTQELLRRGYKEDAIRRILGGNFQRVFAAVQRAAKN